MPAGNLLYYNVWNFLFTNKKKNSWKLMLMLLMFKAHKLSCFFF